MIILTIILEMKKITDYEAATGMMKCWSLLSLRFLT